MQPHKDRLIIDPIPAKVRIGWHEEERANLQDIAICLEFEMDTATAGTTDELAHTIDFGLAYKVQAFAEGSSFKLLESLAEGIAQLCLADHNVQNVRVKASKSLPLEKSAKATVDIYRSSDESVLPSRIPLAQ